jgi:NADH-quinone oxidoreductase subunit G
MCLIEVVGQKRPQIACDTPIKEGMEIKINSELTRAVQRGILELEFINHPLDCPVCDQAGECDLQEYYMKFDKQDSKVSLADKVRKYKREDFGAGVIHDAERCVLCRRCVRFTQLCSQSYELAVGGRGEHSHIMLMNGRKIDNPYAGNIVDVCPVGAMTSADFRFKKRVWHLQKTPAICQGCERGCAIWVDSNKAKYQDSIIYRFRPRENSVNGYFICDYGRYSYKNEQIIKRDDSAKISSLALDIRSNGQRYDILVSSSLSLEEMSAIKEMASKFNMGLYGFSDFSDESFKDEIGLKLRVPNKTANRVGLLKLGISKNLDKKSKNLLIFHLGKDFEFASKFEFDNVIKIGSNQDADIVCASSYHRDGHTLNIDEKLRFSKGAFESVSPKICDIVSELMGQKVEFDTEILKAFV